ncbi:MAG: polysaccharide pyruvyl transferase family protein [Phenylobacterium sp.]|nr:polysaccharide pyruvyl transferase family protein [Phenylobacterium sp.]
MSRPNEIAIGLLWHSPGAGNLGVGALTVGNIASARLAAEKVGLTPRFTVLSFPSELGQDYVRGDDIDVFEINTKTMLSPSGFWSRVAKLDCVLDIGAGDSFADIYGLKRFMFLWLSKELTMLRGVPLVLSPQTIGPFKREPSRSLAAHAMSRAYAVVARDPESLRVIQEVSPRARAIQSVDVAFRLPFDRPPPRATDKLDVGVNVSGLLVNGGYGGANDYGLEIDYAALMRRFIGDLLKRGDVRVHLITHVISPGIPADDDCRVADIFKAEFPEATRAPDFDSPSAAKAYIAGLDFLVAGRMHACIAAYSAGVPVIPVAYSRKFSGLFGGVLKYPHQVPVKGLSTDEALAFLHRGLDERDTLRADISAGMSVVEPALSAYDALLEELFGKIAAGR